MKLDKRFFLGEYFEAYQLFGAHPLQNGYLFTLYAPNAKKVEIIGDFNHWNGKDHVMKKVHPAGIFQLFVEVKEYTLYKYRILTKQNQYLDKADPYAFYSQLRPNSASITFSSNSYQFQDSQWMKKRNKCFNQPCNIYECHLGSWLKKEDGSFYQYDEIADSIITYLKKNHFTHIEVLPLIEYPFDGSWGYQCSGYFSITSRYGTPNQFKKFVDRLHQEKIGVIMDYVITHFVKDSFGLIQFDGSYLFENENPSLRESPWNTHFFDFSKPMVMSFILSSLHYLLSYYHLDGIRFDAVSNLIYHQGNKELGENQSGLNFIKKMNHILSSLHPTVMLIAEDSSDYPNVTRPTFEGGLGFDYKWDLGWMNDTLKYLSIDPLFRGNHLQKINFSMYYFYSERFLLPLSHDEVVHMKGSIIRKIFGSYEEKFAQLKVLYTYMFTHPGKKLNFMGNELALFDEWNENKALDFSILKYPIHDSFYRYFQMLCFLYQKEKCLYFAEYNPQCFRFLVCDDKRNVFIYQRFYQEECLLIVLNFSNVHFTNFPILNLQSNGKYKEILNSDQDIYHGNHCINPKTIPLQNGEIFVQIPSFGACIFRYLK